MMKWVIRGLIALAVLAVLIQFVPYGRDHENPTVTAEPAWDSAQTRDLTVRACYACHSNETEWPWYSHIAPVSWLVQHDVDEGRETLNFSEWDRPQESHEVVEAVREGEMPPRYYELTRARLSDAELDELAAGLERTLGDSQG